MTDSPELLPETAQLIVDFAQALHDKLLAAQIKYGYDKAEWRRDDWEDICRKNLMEHIAKGDPRDVAAYCAFMWHHGWSTKSRPESPPRITAEMAKALCTYLDAGFQRTGYVHQDDMTTIAGESYWPIYEALRSIAAQSPEQGGAAAQTTVFDEEREDFIEYLHKSGAEDNASTFAFWKAHVKTAKAESRAEAQPVAEPFGYYFTELNGPKDGDAQFIEASDTAEVEWMRQHGCREVALYAAPPQPVALSDGQMWPVPSKENAKGGWKIDFKFLQEIQKDIEGSGEGYFELEYIEAILLAASARLTKKSTELSEEEERAAFYKWRGEPSDIHSVGLRAWMARARLGKERGQ